MEELPTCPWSLNYPTHFEYEEGYNKSLQTALGPDVTWNGHLPPEAMKAGSVLWQSSEYVLKLPRWIHLQCKNSAQLSVSGFVFWWNRIFLWIPLKQPPGVFLNTVLQQRHQNLPFSVEAVPQVLSMWRIQSFSLQVNVITYIFQCVWHRGGHSWTAASSSGLSSTRKIRNSWRNSCEKPLKWWRGLKHLSVKKSWES